MNTQKQICKHLKAKLRVHAGLQVAGRDINF